MSRNIGNKPAAPHKKGNPLLTGVLVGMVIGVGMAAGLAWYIMKSPSPFVQKEQVVTKSPVAVAKPLMPAEATVSDTQPAMAASGASEGKPRFEFYKVLTDKQDTSIVAPAKQDTNIVVTDKHTDKHQPADKKPVTADEPQFLQAGSFSNADDAEKLKARLALLGIEAVIQTATIPDKGVWHRVRMGPYKNTDEMGSARSLLKQNGVEATPMRGQ